MNALVVFIRNMGAPQKYSGISWAGFPLVWTSWLQRVQLWRIQIEIE